MSKLDLYISEVLTSPNKKVIRHFLLQLLLLAITSSVLWSADYGMPEMDLILIWAFYYMAINVLVYLNIYVLAKKFLLNNRISTYIISVIGLVAVLTLFIGVLQSFLPEASEISSSVHPILGIISSVAAVSLLFAGTSALVLFGQWILSGQKRSELETLNLAAELRMLKNQINPHFLFNMLNNCYLLVKKGRPEAAEVLFRLEKLLHYQMECISNERVTLNGEIEFLASLLELEKIRRDKFRYGIEDNITANTICLPPMILIPFVENAIKHSNESENLSYIDISFDRWEKGIVFSCTNSKSAPRSEGRKPGGIGLKNIRRRLEMLFPDRHNLTICENDKIYSIILKLEL